MARAIDREAFLDIVGRDYPHLLEVHREFLDRLGLPSNRALEIWIHFHGQDAKNPTYHVYVGPPSSSKEPPYSHALRVHTAGNIYVVWKGNVPGQLAEALQSVYEGMVTSPENDDGSTVYLDDAGAPFEIERRLRTAAAAVKRS